MLKRLRHLRSWRWGMQTTFIATLALLLMGATDSGTRFNTLGHKLMCTCGCGQVLMECNHVGCQSSDRMRGELMSAMQKGGSDDQILQTFVEKYGPVVLAAPTKTGFNRVAWIMPYLTLALGLLLTAVLVRAWKTRSKAAPVVTAQNVTAPELDAMRRRVHEETEI